MNAHAVVLTFDDIGLGHGSSVSNQYNGGFSPATDFGVQISAGRTSGPGYVNAADSVDVAVAFNTELAAFPVSGAPSTYGFDDDLSRTYNVGSNPAGWDGGNLPPNTVVGFALIVQENLFGYSPPGDTAFNAPDDNAGDGFIRFVLDSDRDYTQIQFVIADFEEPDAYSVQLNRAVGASQTFTATDFGLAAGDNFLSQLPFLGFTSNGDFDGPLTGDTITSVDFIFNSASGAIATVALIPEPSSAMLFMAAAGLLALRHKRKR